MSNTLIPESQPYLIVVHCVDTEGPLGGNARRNPDGSKEFFDNWNDIKFSLNEITSNDFRKTHSDSLGNPYVYNWFIMDFTGFKTNPKNRVAEYHDTLDQIKSLQTDQDGFYWHYHLPPANGVGDQWSDTWLSSNECNNILARRLIQRHSFPEAFRAGGTIEDNPASHWLEHAVLLDYSNRVSERSYPDADLFRFNWYGAPKHWGSYNPNHKNFLEKGQMKRAIYRCIDLKSRYNDLTQSHLDECFETIKQTKQNLVLSYFSHDNRDMRAETYDSYSLIKKASAKHGIPWVISKADEAHRLYHNLDNEIIDVQFEAKDDIINISTNNEPFQPTPFTAIELHNGDIFRVYTEKTGKNKWTLKLPVPIRTLGIAVTSMSGNNTILVKDL